ncbi:YchJ family protein [Parendozoicomonas haliclonae]|uniref:UPF0225 protein EHSB41UT_04374 n=1 Tax=Parendozoicomonas haliclonae TaxID=1960125 RepID=A0A1X7AQY9_9GAMM|nr:YchJ family protein [Parendozoicomonas haliclonae]SMA50563.1 hypothetical protein EHSB41UT_04374 [Parendozoicomonas haliclonae]
MPQTISPDASCLCGSQKTYAECCQPFHHGFHNKEALPQTAKQLMRSRYCAWALGMVDYIFDTTWPKQQAGLSRKDLQDWADRTAWQELIIVDTAAGQAGDKEGEVEFKARFRLPPVEKIHEHHERSRFVHEDDRWFFVDPTLPVRSATTVGRNDPCPCGSGKKYKKCCG